jgi:ABC-type transport system involved in multi-copper enzyme maturation permease subunit
VATVSPVTTGVDPVLTCRRRLPLLWVSWRQHGAALTCGLGLFALTSVVLLATEYRIREIAADLAPNWRQLAPIGWSAHYPDVAMQAIPLLIGLLVGVPLVSRDIEAGTATFAWTQGTGRIRWLLGKFTYAALPLSVAAASFGQVFGWWFSVYAPVTGRWGMSAFPLFSPACVGWTLAGLTLGMAAGVILRRSSARAMAAAIAGWIFLHYIQPFATERPVAQFWQQQFLSLGWLLSVSLLLMGVTVWIISRSRPPAFTTRLAGCLLAWRDRFTDRLARRRLVSRLGVSMLGVTWRQHRRALLVGQGLLAATAVALLITGLRLHSEPASRWPTLFQALGGYTPGQQNGDLAVPLFFPFFIGAFLGAPLVARELELGTARFAWTQGVSRTQWLTGKLIRLGLLLAASAIIVGLVFQWWYAPLVADASRLGDPEFGLYAPVFAGWMLASFTLAAFLGAVLRNSSAAIVVTIVSTVILAIVNAVQRQYWLPPVTGPAAAMPRGAPIFNLGYAWQDGSAVGSATLHKLYYLAASMHIKAGPGQEQMFARHHVIWSATYLPDSRFWPLQLIETAGLLTLALLFAAATVLLVRSRSA